MTNQKILAQSDRILLRPLSVADVEDFTLQRNNPEARRFYGDNMQYPSSVEGNRRLLEQWLALADACFIAVRLKETGDYIGMTGVLHLSTENKNAEFYLYLGDAKYWGKGFGTEATNLCVDWCFETFQLHRIYLGVMEKNVAARKIYERAGFRVEGLRRECYFRNGEYQSLLTMGLLRREWEAGHAGRAAAA